MTKLNETGAHRALTDTARMRLPAFADPLEHTQRMTVAQRRYRQFEARVRRAGISSPVDTHDFRDGDPTRDWFTNVTRNGCRDES